MTREERYQVSSTLFDLGYYGFATMYNLEIAKALEKAGVVKSSPGRRHAHSQSIEVTPADDFVRGMLANSIVDDATGYLSIC